MKRRPEERRRRILELLTGGSVTVSELARRMRVSEVSILRDLAALKREGRLLRVYGGAAPSDRLTYEFSFKEKEAQRAAEKEAIGRAAAELVEPGAAVFLDSGTTPLAVARALRARRPALIVTINLAVASEYAGLRDVRVLIPGGEVSRISPDVYGEWTLELLSRVTTDAAFIGCDSVDPKDGFYAVNTSITAVARLMVARSRRTYLVADSSKFGRRSVCRIGRIGELDAVVADAGLAPTFRRAVRKEGAKLILAK